MTEEKKDGVFDKKISRREMLKMTGIGAAGVAIGASGMGGILSSFGKGFSNDVADDHTATNKVDFYGTNQAGVATPAQTHIYFASLTALVRSKAELKKLFQDWTPLAAKLTNGQEIGTASTHMVPPTDTGEAVGNDAKNLTLTFGIGQSLFDKLKMSGKPKELKKLPHFPKDQLEDTFSDGDICIQACADDPQVAFHAIRNLVRAASGRVTMKWTQAGFNSIVKKDGKSDTPRNLFAFKDGTENPRTKDDFNNVVFIQSGESQPWMVGGTYLIARRIQMHLETWDRTALDEQENTFGRHRDSGAPLGKEKEYDSMEIDRKDEKGNLIVPDTSHVFLAKSVKARLLRRSFSYASGVVDATGTHDAGLLFVSFQKDPKQFIDIQNSLGRRDKMNEYITHRGSALFACFPGVRKGSFIGEAFFNTL